jgi:hypothetical protein
VIYSFGGEQAPIVKRATASIAIVVVVSNDSAATCCRTVGCAIFRAKRSDGPNDSGPSIGLAAQSVAG